MLITFTTEEAMRLVEPSTGNSFDAWRKLKLRYMFTGGGTEVDGTVADAPKTDPEECVQEGGYDVDVATCDEMRSSDGQLHISASEAAGTPRWWSWM